MIIYLCEDSLEGVFTAIYRAYEEKRDHTDTVLSLTEEPLLFAEYVKVEPDLERTRKVMNTLRRRFGEDDYLALCQALASEDPDKAQAVYRTVVDGLRRSIRPGHLLDNLADDYVHKAFSLSRGTGREISHLEGFVRFQELENKVLYAVIGPRNNVLTFLMPHFADRLPLENFVIFDDRRNLFGIHPSGRQWYLLREEEAVSPVLKLSEEERQYQELFRQFCRTIAIRERRNLELQKSMLPLRFQEYMMEFQESV